MKPDQWAQATWSFVEAGDFVKVKDVIWRVDGRPDETTASFTLVNPVGSFTGTPKLDALVLVRIAQNGERTPAGRRDDGLSSEGERALKEKLGAEFVAYQDRTGRTFNPYVLAERMTAPALASHLFQWHELYVGEVKSADGVELRKAHAALHAADAKSQPETARRIPHVHDEKAFQEAL